MLTLALALLPAAPACPTLATGTPSELTFDTAQVVLARQDGRTTMTLSVNPLGDPQGFALVLPVPELLREEQIRTLDGDLFRQLDVYTAPRRVEDAGCGYSPTIPCPDEDGGGSDGGEGEGEGEGEAPTTGDSGVAVEAEYLVGSYEVAILSAEESGGLQVWLDEHGYHLPEGSEERLAEYIDAGSYFLVAKVSSEAARADGSALMPLQVSYKADLATIPIRLAAVAAVEAQDMIVYVLVEQTQGQAAISNYPEMEVPETCLWGSSDEDFSAFYQDHFREAWAEAGGAAWATEFSNLAGDCYPCTAENPFAVRPEEVLHELGYRMDPEGGMAGLPWLTRLHMRYTRELAGEDLVLYSSGIVQTEALTFADDTTSNRWCIELDCDGDPVETPPDPVSECADEDGAASGPQGSIGCSALPRGGLVALLVGAAAALRRRR